MGRPTSKQKPRPVVLTTGTRRTADTLLAAILADPDSDEPRLVYADALQQQGDPRGEFITLQCALARLDPKHRGRRALADREAELWKQHGKQWSSAAQAGKLMFARGFAEIWKLRPGELVKHAEAVFAREPIRVLDLSKGNLLDPDPPHLLAALQRPELARVRRLELRRYRLGVDLARAVFALPTLANLRELDVAYVPMSRTAVEALTSNATFRELEVLRLHGCKLDRRFVGSLIAAPYAGTLRTLDVGKTGLDDAAIVELARSSLPLRALDISRCRVTADAWSALLETKMPLERVRHEGLRPSPELKRRLEARFTLQ